MKNSHQSFLKMGIDLAPLGVERRECEAAYFCTPKGASIIGWAGVDGIHYCFIRDFGETVFAVSPMNSAPDYVHPLAVSFTDFLRLLLACGDAAVLEQAWLWDEAQFDAFLKENPPTERQRSVLAELAGKLKLTPMEEPWQYIKSLQASFDYSRIKYTEDFYDPDMNENAQPKMPEWRVFFDGNYWGHRGRDRAGKEISVGKEYRWAERRCLIPAVYSCSKGLVVEFCIQIEPERIRAFMDKWDLTPENELYKCFSKEERMQLELENPLSFNFRPKVMVNGWELKVSHSCGISYNPCLEDGTVNDLEVKWVMEHYGLDPAYGWIIRRCAFPWKIKRRPEVKTLSVTMEQEPVSVPGPNFSVDAPGDTFGFTLPETGIRHTLTVQEYEQQKMDFSMMPDARDMEYPPYYIVMSFIITPEPPKGAVSITDCAEGDRPRRRQCETLYPFAPEAKDDVAVGIIGGADGPTAIVFGGGGQGKLRAACSALHFEPVEDVRWRIEFHEKQFDDLTVKLL